MVLNGFYKFNNFTTLNDEFNSVPERQKLQLCEFTVFTMWNSLITD